MMYFRNLIGGKFEIPENAIQYTSVYGKLRLSDPNIIKHQYNSGIGYVTYNSDVLSSDLFIGESILSINLPPTITTLDEEAFKYCSTLTTLTLPNTITESRNAVFWNCYKLQHVHIPDLSSWLKINYISNSGHPFWAVTSGDLYINGEKLTDITIPEDITTIPFSVFFNCKGLTNITIPNHVTAIGRLAFGGCGITKIVIPDSVVTMQDQIFKNCTKLKEVTLPKSLTAITEQMFYKCNTLESVVIPESVTTIDKEAFAYCKNLKSINIPTTLTYIDGSAFNSCNVERVDISDLTSWCNIKFNTLEATPVRPNTEVYLNGNLLSDLIIPNDITQIKNYMFANFPITSVLMHDDVTSIGEHSFFKCANLTTIHISNKVTFIDFGAFKGCTSLAQIVIPDNVITLGDYVFSYCENLEYVKIGNGVETIPSTAFSGCTSLKTVVLGSSVKNIEDYAMYGCTSLESIYVKSNTVVDQGYDSIPNNANLKIYVPFDLVEAYNNKYQGYSYNIIGFDFENNDI